MKENVTNSMNADICSFTVICFHSFIFVFIIQNKHKVLFIIEPLKIINIYKNTEEFTLSRQSSSRKVQTLPYKSDLQIISVHISLLMPMNDVSGKCITCYSIVDPFIQ